VSSVTDECGLDEVVVWCQCENVVVGNDLPRMSHDRVRPGLAVGPSSEDVDDLHGVVLHGVVHGVWIELGLNSHWYLSLS
jgi:hypothetical protein